MHVFDALKHLLRVRGATYRDLARMLRMSESGVKKMFAAEDCSLARLEEIAQVVGFTLAELFDVAARPPIEHVELSDEQQSALLDSPVLLAVFWKLTVELWSTKRIATELRLDAPTVRRAIAELDRLDLIVLEQPGDRIRLRHGDLVRWTRGPLLDHLHALWGRDVLDRARAGGTFRLHQIRLREESHSEFVAELSSFLDDWIRRAKAEALTSLESDTPPYGLLVALGEGSFVRAPVRSR